MHSSESWGTVTFLAKLGSAAWLAFALSFVVTTALAQPAAESEAHAPVPPAPPKAEPAAAEELAVPPPPFSDDIFPCMECHADQETNLERRELEDMHEDILLDHGPRERWCFDCHSPDNRDQLRLANGAPVLFSESYRLCGQCHGPKLRDWRVGVHGKRQGNWDGKKSYLLCAHCHNPHAPRFKPIAPMPPPTRPGQIR